MPPDGRKGPGIGKDIPSPPKTLGPAGRRLWKSVLGSWRLTSEHLDLLRVGCEALDTFGSSTALVRAEGVCVRDRFGHLRAHPAAAVARDATSSLTKIMKALDLREDPKRIGRPPGGGAGSA